MASETWLEWLAESLAPLRGVSLRRMFGGHGVFRAGAMFGLVVADRLYLKVDTATEARYRAAASRPFRYTRRGQEVALGYWLVPEAVLEEPEALLAWADEASAVAQRGRKG